MTIVGGIAVGVFERIVLVERRRAQPVDRRPLPVRRRARAGPVRRSATSRDDTGWSLSAQVKPIPERLRSLWYVRHLPMIGFVVLFGFLALLPLFLSQRSQEFLWTEIVIYALVALSITPLAGWAGQLSLGQFAFVGLGALDDGRAPRRPRHPGAVRPLGHERCRWRGSRRVVCSTRVGVAAAIIIGIPALRGPRPVPRGDHARVRGDVLELAVPPAGVHRLGVRHDARRASTRR